MSPLLNEGRVSILHVGIHTASLVFRGSLPLRTTQNTMHASVFMGNMCNRLHDSVSPVACNMLALTSNNLFLLSYVTLYTF